MNEMETNANKLWEEKVKSFRANVVVIVLGLLSIFGWYFHVRWVLRAFFYDASSSLGYLEDYGMIINSYNLYGELVFEIVLYSAILIYSVIVTLGYLIRLMRLARGKVQ